MAPTALRGPVEALSVPGSSPHSSTRKPDSYLLALVVPVAARASSAQTRGTRGPMASRSSPQPVTDRGWRTSTLPPLGGYSEEGCTLAHSPPPQWD